jgi:uncharacterized protein
MLVAGHEVAVSPQVIEELKRVVLAKFIVDETDLDTFIRRLLSVAVVSVLPYIVKFSVRDPDDIDILAASVKSDSDVLVTGDKDLLDMQNPPIRIL